MHFFVRECEISLLRERLRRAHGGPRRDLLIELAWYLRQTNTIESLALAAEAEQLIQRASGEPLEAANRLDARRISLIRGESFWLQGDCQSAAESASLLRAGHQVGADDATEIDIAFLLASVAGDRGDSAAVDRHLDEALALARDQRDEQRSAIAVARQSQWRALRLPLDACDAIALDVESIAASGDPVRATWAHDVRATLAKRRGDESAVIDALVCAYSAARESGQSRRAVTAAVNIVVCFNNLKLHSSAGDWLERALACSATNAWPVTTALCLVATAQCLKLHDKLEPALDSLQAAMDVLTTLPDANFCRLNAICSMADVHMKRGDHAAALTAFDRLIEIATREQLPHLLPLALTERAVALAGLGQMDDAIVAAEHALQTVGSKPATSGRHSALWALGRVHTLRAGAAKTPSDVAQASAEALRYLEAAYQNGTELTDYAVEPALMDQLAETYAARQDFTEAYRFSRLARAAVAAQHATHSVDQMTALEVRARTEAAAVEASAQRRLAHAESARSAVLTELNQTLQSLSEVGRALAASRDADGLLASITAGLRQFVDAPRVAIWQLDAGGQHLVLRHAHGRSATVRPAAIAIADMDCEIARCARERRESHVRAEPGAPASGAADGTQPPGGARLVLPLVVDDRLAGLVEIQSDDSDAYGDRARLLVRMLCAHGAVALDNAHAYEQLERRRREFEDISLREKAARARAEAATEMKSRFLATVSHELRAPLNAILGFSQLLAGGFTASTEASAAQRSALKTISGAGDHLLMMANDLLDLGQIELGVLTVRLAPVDLNEALQDAIGFMQVAAQAAGVVVTLETVKSGPALVVADQTRLRQVTINLVSNAIKYNRAGGHVAITVERHGQRLRFVVADTGQGMSPAQLTAIFQPFNRLGQESSGAEGVGIGLTITQRLVALMGGVITVTSTAGVGSRFTVELQAAQALKNPEHAEASAATLHPRGIASAETQGRVLYIDDDPLARLLMSACFNRRPQIELCMSESGASGLEQLSRFRPQLVLLDLNMPEESGVQVMQEIRQRLKMQGANPARIVAVSGDAGSQHIHAALAAGFDAYLTKPIDARAMLAEADFALRRS